MKLLLEELYKLAADRPLLTSEIHTPNDFYCHATILKQYAQLKPQYQLKAVIEHGAKVAARKRLWDVEINAPLPAYFTFSAWCHTILRKQTNKALFSIGPMFSYAPQFFDTKALEAEKKRLEKTLLIFPVHSSHWVDQVYDIHSYCQFIEEIGKDFDSIQICLGWKDILRGHAEEYMQHGFECVTAGHMYDPLFLSRLKSIIELSTITVSFSLGTHIGYCILSGKPHYISQVKYQSTAENDDILRRDTHDTSKTPYGQEMLRAFGELRDDISSQQKELVERYWGLSEYKTVNEMRLILQTTEDMYKKGRTFYISNRDVLTEQALDYLNSNDNEKALFLLNQAIAVNPDMSGLNYGKAVAHARLGNISEAFETLNQLLTVIPDHKKAKLLLQELRANGNQLRETDIFIASYPRSGNTWLRLLLSDIILQIHKFKTDTVLPIHQDRIIPDIYTNNLYEIDPRIDLPYRLIKTHEKFNPNIQKNICLFRQATDALCSYYYFHRRYQHLRSGVTDGVDAFCKKRLDKWCEHLNSYIQAKTEQEADILFVSYEWLHADTVGALRQATEFLGLPANEQMCRTAVENHTFQKHHGVEKESGKIGGKYFEYFFRKGKIGGSAKELQEATLKTINDKTVSFYQRATALQPIEYSTHCPISKPNSPPASIESDGSVRKPDSLFMEGIK